MRSHILLFVLLAIVFTSSVSAGGTQASDDKQTRLVSVFLPADPDNHPLYAMVVAGVKTVTESLPAHETRVTVVGSENPLGPDALAGDALAPDALAPDGASSTERVELVVVAGSPLTASAGKAAARRPEIPFLMVDGALPDSPNAANLLINRREQAYLAGFIAGMRLNDFVEEDEAALAGLFFESGLLMAENMVQPAFRLGLRAARTNNDLLIRRHGREGIEDEVERSLDVLERRNVPVLLPFHYWNVEEVVKAAAGRELDIIRVDEHDPDTGQDQTLAAVTLDIEETVSHMVRDILDEGPEAVGTVRADFRSGALSLENGFSRFESALTESSRTPILEMAERLASGDLTLDFKGLSRSGE